MASGHGTPSSGCLRNSGAQAPDGQHHGCESTGGLRDGQQSSARRALGGVAIMAKSPSVRRRSDHRSPVRSGRPEGGWRPRSEVRVDPCSFARCMDTSTRMVVGATCSSDASWPNSRRNSEGSSGSLQGIGTNRSRRWVPSRFGGLLERCLDYFVLGPELSALAGQMTRHMDTHIYGHFPVSIHLRHSVELRAVSVLSRPRAPKGLPEHAEGPLCLAIEAEMRELALPWSSPVIRGENEVREAYRLETEAKWIRWDELAERWRWASITGEEPLAAAKGHGRVSALV